MNRILQILGIGVALTIGGALVYNALHNPAASRRGWLAQRLEDARISPADPNRAQVDLAGLKKAIAAKPSLWKELVAAAPPPVIAPDLKKMLEGVTATLQEIGPKVKLTTKDNPQGDYFAQGDAFNGLTVKSITPKEVVFSLNQNGQEYTLGLPRQ